MGPGRFASSALYPKLSFLPFQSPKDPRRGTTYFAFLPPEDL